MLRPSPVTERGDPLGGGHHLAVDHQHPVVAAGQLPLDDRRRRRPPRTRAPARPGWSPPRVTRSPCRPCRGLTTTGPPSSAKQPDGLDRAAAAAPPAGIGTPASVSSRRVISLSPATSMPTPLVRSVIAAQASRRRLPQPSRTRLRSPKRSTGMPRRRAAAMIDRVLGPVASRSATAASPASRAANPCRTSGRPALAAASATLLYARPDAISPTRSTAASSRSPRHPGVRRLVHRALDDQVGSSPARRSTRSGRS